MGITLARGYVLGTAALTTTPCLSSCGVASPPNPNPPHPIPYAPNAAPIARTRSGSDGEVFRHGLTARLLPVIAHIASIFIT